MEFVDIVNDDDVVIGKETLEIAHKNHLLHRLSSVFMVRGDGSILVQVRKTSKKTDMSASGHVPSGETYYQAAIRELSEELNVSSPIAEIGKCQSSSLGGIWKHIHTVFVCPERPISPNYEEIGNAEWVQLTSIVEDLHREEPSRMYTGGFRPTFELLLRHFGRVDT